MNLRLLSPVVLAAGLLLAACGAPQQTETHDAGPRGYVAFYIPADDPAYSDLHVGAQIYRIEAGKRVFVGSTQKWKNLVPARHGLTVALPPGAYTFSVEMAGGAAPVSLTVEQDVYTPVRIGAVDLVRSQMIGMSEQVHFNIRATPETPIPPGRTPH
ncbi:MAG: hypothetical protein LDL19_05675 [Thiobacillus sp.]|nr:hypothetical protein [Thiobacillus sp.]